MSLRDALLAVASEVESLDAGAGRSYRHDREHLIKQTGESKDRTFYFDDVSRTTLLEVTSKASRVEYVVPLVMQLRTAKVARFEQIAESAQAGAQVARAIERRATWPAGVQAVIVEGMDVFRSDETERDSEVVVGLAITVIEGD